MVVTLHKTSHVAGSDNRRHTSDPGGGFLVNRAAVL
jgi:hypothetical protein